MKHDIPALIVKAIAKQRLRIRDLRAKQDPESLNALATTTSNLALLESIKDAFDGNVTALRDYT